MQLLTQLHSSGKCRVHLACLQNRGSLRLEADQLGIGEIHEYALNSFYDLNFVKQLRRLVRSFERMKSMCTHALFLYEHLRHDRGISCRRARPRYFEGRN